MNDLYKGEKKKMQAEIKIGEWNICVECGQVKITDSLDEDGLPVCVDCTHKGEEDHE